MAFTHATSTTVARPELVCVCVKLVGFVYGIPLDPKTHEKWRFLGPQDMGHNPQKMKV